MEKRLQETNQNIDQKTAPHGKPARMASIELLRSLAMLMVITLHYLDKGGILVPLTEKQSIAGFCAWLLEAFCIVAVNTYVLVSGYFLTESGFKLQRLFDLVAQLLFYSILVPAVLVLCGILPASELTLYHLLNYVFPVQMDHYWFATAYILMYLFAPVLSAGVKQLTQKQLKTVIALLLIMFSLSKSILPFQLSIDKHGYDVVWFLCLFLTAAYIRLYGIPGLNQSNRGFLLYAGSCVGIFALAVCLAFFSSRLGKFEYFVSSTFDYNHILCLLGAIGLFIGFLHWNMPEGKLASLARKIAPYTFGVYLLHENREVRYLWPQWLGIDRYGNGNWSIFHWLGSILLVFAVGILIDFLRSLLFRGVESLAQSLTKRIKGKQTI